ncbi:MAG: glycosyltransferase family 39 protein, partial [Anaerolineales bacterium]|nr:glycosyltransferase family 39 protein [Anaerolineales bacterium]
MDESSTRKLILKKYSLPLILFASVALRILAAFILGNQVIEFPGTYDQISYHQLALRVLSGNGFSFGEDWWPLTEAGAPTAHWSYLYTYYLVIVYKLFGSSVLMARLIQAVLVGIFHPYLVFLLGRSVFNRRVGLLAAGLTSVYAYFIYYAATLMTEPFYITGILLALCLTIRIGNQTQRSLERQARKQRLWQYCLLGITLGMTLLLRQLFLLVVPILFLYLLWRQRKRALFGILVASILIILMILPFSLYNYDRFDQFVLLNTNAGFAFFWANHP